jgi:hypothetical protein
VSPLWRDELGVHLAPSRVWMVRLKRGLKPIIDAECEQQVETAGTPDWTGALQAVDSLLAQPQWRGAGLRVVIDDCWARYAIVPWVAALRTADERLDHARQLLASSYGDAVVAWEVQVSEAPPQISRVACTVPTELLSAVRSMCLNHGARLISLQPQLVAAYQNWRNSLPPVGVWFVTVGTGTLAAARLGDRAWDRVYNVRIGSDWLRELKRLQTFGRISAGNPEEGRVYVEAPCAWRALAGETANDLHWLEDDAGPLTTLQRLSYLRRYAA